MNSKDRMRAAMTHQIPDRVPVMCQLSLGHYFIYTGYAPADIWFDSNVYAAALVQRALEYEFDGILINLPGRPANWREYIDSRQDVNGMCQIHWKNGLLTKLPMDDNPRTYMTNMQALPHADISGIDVNNPETYRIAGYVWNTWHIPELWQIDRKADLADPRVYPAWFTAPLRQVQQHAPDKSIHVEVFSPFTHLMELLGYEQALFALIEKPQLCHALLFKFTQIVLAQILVYAVNSPDAILISSAFAGAGFISRQMYQNFVLPYELEVARAISIQHLISYTHTCGAIGDRLDLMAQTEVNGIDTLDPPPLGTCDLGRAKADYGTRFFFKGNLDSVSEMLHADGQIFENAVKDRLRAGKPGGGYILSSACSVAPYVRPEMLKRLAELSRKFGGYDELVEN
jgi:hypothetical protein